MKCTLAYCSKSNGNTLKVVRAIAARFPEIELVDARETPADQVDLAGRDLVVLASGIYFGFPDRSVARLARRLGKGRRVVLVTTHGSNSTHYEDKWARSVQRAGLDLVGTCGCQGFYNFGPFGIKGGIHRGHPSDEEVRAVAEAFAHLYERAAGGEAAR